MDLSIFLAKITGVFLIFSSAAILVHRKHCSNIIEDYFSNRALVLFSGSITLLIGLLIVISHNIWQSNWRSIITIIGWLILIKGVVRIFAPSRSLRFANKIIRSRLWTPSLVVILIMGIYLTYLGFTV